MPNALIFEWNGEAMVPMQRFHNIANAEYVVGQLYKMDVMEERSLASHNHYFASLTDLWLTLPERLAVSFPSVEHLRKHALCLTGYRDERTFVAASKAEALRLAAFIRPVDEYAIVSVNEATVVVWTAQSQSRRAMGKDRFQQSKDDVTAYVEEMIGVKPQASEAAA